MVTKICPYVFFLSTNTNNNKLIADKELNQYQPLCTNQYYLRIIQTEAIKKIPLFGEEFNFLKKYRQSLQIICDEGG